MRIFWKGGPICSLKWQVFQKNCKKENSVVICIHEFIESTFGICFDNALYAKGPSRAQFQNQCNGYYENRCQFHNSVESIRRIIQIVSNFNQLSLEDKYIGCDLSATILIVRKRFFPVVAAVGGQCTKLPAKWGLLNKLMSYSRLPKL